MKILFVVHPFHKGKVKYKESHFLTISGLKKELELLGHKVRILQTKKLFPKTKGQYDVVHGFSSAPVRVLATWYIGKSQKAKTIHTIKGISPHLFGGYRFARLLNIVDIVAVPLKCLKQRFQEKGVNNIEIVHSSIDVKKFKPRKVRKEKRFQGKPMILYWGALWPEKGINELLKAARLLPEINFVILPRYNIYYEIEDSSLWVSPNIFLLKNDKSLAKHLNMCDIVCLPYRTLARTDANPSCLLEAWANKKPLITTDLEELRELGGKIGCENFRIACFAEPNDPKYLASSIKTVLKRPKWTRQIAKNAYKYVHQFDHKIIAKKYEALYNDNRR